MQVKLMSDMRKLGRHVRQVVVDYQTVTNEVLMEKGQQLIFVLCHEGEWSLRGLAKASNLSPTYLSQVKSGNVVISPGAFLRVLKAAGILSAET